MTPNFEFTANCQGQAVLFSDSTDINSGNSIVSWSWSFGDGNVASVQNPSHIYAITGNYSVTLTVITAQGCSNSITETVTIHPPPVASFTINNNPVNCNQEQILFTNNSIGNGLTYLWTFGNGSTSELQTPVHTVPPMPNSCSGFNYTIQLMVTDIYGCTAYATQVANVQPRPTAEIVSASHFLCAVTVNGVYEAEQTIFNLSTAPCLDYLLFDWGDGSPLENGDITQIDFTHIYSTPGLIPMIVYGVSNGGACTTVVHRDTVLVEITPTAGIIGPSATYINGCVPFSTYFILNSEITSTTTQQVIWGGMDTVNLSSSYEKGDTVWHTFTVSGCDSAGVMTPYNVILRAQNQCGSSVTTWGDFAVHRPPTAHFTVPDTICKNDLITFVNTSSRNLCGGWTVTQFNWRIFKNGVLIINQNSVVADANSILPDFSFAFQDTGFYQVILTATDNGNYGCGSTAFSKTLFVQGTFANFYTDTVCLGNPTSFFDSSYAVNGYLTSWFWDFGDGGQSIDTNTFHTYGTPGFHNVTHIVFDSNNCSDTIMKPAYVSPYPVSGFTFDTVCIGTATSFTDLSYTTAIDSIVYWEWWFGDSTTSYLQNPSHLYASDGFYSVTLIVSTTFACPDTITRVVYVSPLPVAQFLSDSACFGNPTTFTDLSYTSAIDSIVFWEWDFGDGTIVNDTNPLHVFLTEGFHNVLLTIGTSIGCTDTITNLVYVSPLPTADFYFDTVCLGYPVTFLDSSLTNSLANIDSWFWVFGDGDSSFLQSPAHMFPDTGNFTVTFYITTTLGCTDSISQSIYVNPYPIVNFTSTTVCLGTVTQFTDHTTTSPIDHIISWNWDFGGGATSTLQNPSYTFATAGYHPVSLHTVSHLGCEETVTHNAYVSPFPVPDFFAPPACLNNANLFADSSSTTGIHPINQWYWTFGDGSTSTVSAPNHIYADTGVYQISLVVASSLNCVSDTIFGTTYVSPYPQAVFSFDTVCLTHPTSFVDLSATVANDSIVSWLWSFGDGSTSTLQNPLHIYADSGHYNVTLISGSSIGCTDTATAVIYVKPLPFPEFSVSNVCLGDTTFLSDLSTHAPIDNIILWNWQFGDGSGSTAQHPSHVYSDTGVYQISLIVTSNLGCSDSITHGVYASPFPTSLFSTDSVCLNNATTLNNLSFTVAQDSIVTWQWLYGDGNMSTIQNPTHTYADTGHFDISLVVTTSIGCTDTSALTTYISPYPTALFNADTACLGNPTLFTDLSFTLAIDSIIGWYWSFGDGNFSNNPNPVHTYSDTGFYHVSLIVLSSLGCGDTIHDSVYVKPLPTPDFSATTVCIGNTTVFTDLSYSSLLDTINQWVWQFGDGFSSNSQHPVHTYADSGFYTVTLIVSSSIGCADSISHVVYVSPGPVAVFETDTVCAGGSTTFSDLSYTLAADSLTQWQWQFGDGNSSAQQNPLHAYADTGFYNVTLIISTSIGCTDTLVQSAYQSPMPTALFIADTACLNGPTTFTDQSFTPAIDSITQWFWNFGDGQTSSQQNPQHVYADSGNYTVSLIVWSALGCSDTSTIFVYVNAPPVASFSAAPVCFGNTTLFTDSSQASVHDIITGWAWQFGDGNTATVQNPTHTYADTGSYNAGLVVTTLLGCSDTLVIPVYVSPYPEAVFETDTVCAGGSTTFSDLSYTLAADSLTQWQWQFGDGNGSAQQNPLHTYADTGFYNVTLIIGTSIGCTDTLVQSAYQSPMATALFIADTACLNGPTSFTDQSFTPAIDSITQWFWNFGDGQTSTQQNPQHVYADSGYYTVSLIVTSHFGCQDTFAHAIYVKPLPTANFSAPYVCFGQQTVFNDLSISSPVDTVSTWLWNFGDGNSSNLQYPTHMYGDTGFFAVTLSVQSSIGCANSLIQNVYVSAYPTAGFVSDTVCTGSLTSFTDFSFTPAQDSIVSWLWQFGDNTSDTLQHPLHLYLDTGYFNVQLLVTTGMGCADTVSTPVFVSPAPVADFAADSVCLGLETIFSDLSYSLAFDTLEAWQWDFGDGNTSQAQNPSHVYADTGMYVVKLTVYTQIGCSDTLSKQVYVKPLPVSGFYAASVCLGGQTIFTDTSVAAANDGIADWQWIIGGQSYFQQNMTYTYTDTGFFDVTLISYGLLGCTDTLTKPVYVSPYPVASFSADTVCMGSQTSFSDLSYVFNNDSIVSWFWDFGDGSTSTLQNPQHTYSDSGFFQVSLTVITSIGCSDTITLSVYVSPSPIADFNVLPVCLGNPSVFTDASFTYAIDTIHTWQWDFGDGNTSLLQNPQHTYADTGSYSVTLHIESTIGCPHQITQSAYVSPYPTASFIADTVCFGIPVAFTDMSSTLAQDSLNNWLWDFGSGNQSALQNPTHIFASTGFHQVTLITASAIGCTDTATNSVYVSPYPTADFVADTACQGGLSTFTNLSSTTATDSLSTWFWDFGDGNTSTLQNPTHTYTGSGVFNVTLISGSTIGCTDTIIHAVYVSPPPLIVFGTDSACFGFENSFTDLTNVTIPDSAISWLWDFGDGNSDTLQNTQHVYADTGHYNVSLTLTTAIGCAATETGDAYVKPHPYTGFDAFTTCFGDTVLFTDTTATAPNDFVVTWQWDFGDSQTSSLQSPAHLYTDTGTFNVMLVTLGHLGCTDTVYNNIHIVPLPQPGFAAQAVCFGQSIAFNDISEAFGYTIADWYWNFGDGNNSTVQNPVHTYAQPGNYLVTLTVTNQHNCTDSITMAVTVYDLPIPLFGADSVCLNEATLFTDLTTPTSNPIETWNWNYGDGATAAAQHPDHYYATDGTFDVWLVVTDTAGCTDSIMQSIFVKPLPVADFATDSICSGDTAHFTDISTSVSGMVNSWQWNFGDGVGLSVLQNPSYLYNQVTTISDFSAALIVSNTYGCYDTVTHILRVNPLPVVQFAADTACFGNETHFTGLSYSNGGPLSNWNWDFGDNNGTSTTEHPNYLYSNQGIFNVTLSVSDIKGCADTTSLAVLVDSLPMPSFDWCQVCTNNQMLPITFTNTAQGNGSTITQNFWTFGNGQSSQQSTGVTNNYSTAGNYDVTLTTVNDRGCSDSITQTITVHSGLSIDFTFQVNCFDVSFYATSTNATSLIEWEWDFGDGNYANSHDSATHTYFQPGTYLITLTVYDSLACLNLVCSATISHYIYIYPPPVANFMATNVLVGMATDFTDQSQAPLSSIVAWQWDFGDGDSSNLQNPTHTYGQYGVYDVTLIVTNGYGCSETITLQVIVYPALIAGFDSDTVCAQAPMLFNNTSQVLLPGVPVFWFWDFGDGQTSTDSVPTHTYNFPGTYQVMLIVSMSAAVADTAYGTILVVESPIADFLFTEICWGDTLTTLSNNTNSVFPLTQLRWDLGDGSMSTWPVVHHHYPQYGTYSVLLIVENIYGCTDSIRKDVTVFDVPDVIFDAEPKFGCQPFNVAFSDLSTVNDAMINNWFWNYGNTLGSVGSPTPNHVYDTPGNFDVTLTVTTSQGCSSTVSYPAFIHVYPKPQADFTYTPTVAFTTDMVYFENNSTGSIAWFWDFGDGENSISFNPHHIFFEGFNEVSLVAYNEFNCADTAFRTIHIKETTLLYVPNAFSPLNNDGLNDAFMVSGTNIENLEMRIFNRYGEMIFFTDDINKGWDGKHEGRIVPLGVYVWKIWYRDAYGYQQEKYGTVTVVY